MEITDRISPLAPIVGAWKSSGRMLDEHGNETMRIDGTDRYEVMPGGAWVIHHVDVMMGDERTRALEMIGDPGDDGAFAMRAFDASGGFDTMTLRVDGRTFHAEGNGVRFTLTVAPDEQSMSVLWERQVTDWTPWMEMNFVRMG